jgi:hypothetical protein
MLVTHLTAPFGSHPTRSHNLAPVELQVQPPDLDLIEYPRLQPLATVMEKNALATQMVLLTLARVVAHKAGDIGALIPYPQMKEAVGMRTTRRKKIAVTTIHGYNST